MNYNDYNRAMAYGGLRSSPGAEEQLAEATVCANNIRLLKKRGDPHNQIPEYLKRKERYIEKALEESYPGDLMEYPPDWDINCKFIRETLIEGDITKEIQLTGGNKWLKTVKKQKAIWLFEKLMSDR